MILYASACFCLLIKEQIINKVQSWIQTAQSAILPLLVLIWGGLLWAPTAVFGDGQVFPEIRVDPVVIIPDQQALLSFENGQEKLVIETAFIGSGTNFAWVIPFPAEPEITAVSPAFFPSLRSAFKPALVHEVRYYWLAFLVAGLWIYLINRSLRDEVTWVNDLPWCLLVALAAGWSFKSAGIGLVLLFFLVLIRLLRTTQNLAIVSLVFLAAASIFPLVAPFQRGLIQTMTLANGGQPALVSAVTIHNRQLAGIYETTTVSSRDAQAMQRWLSTNGYSLPKSAETVIADYVRDGWFFVAAKARRPAHQTSPASFHPVGFTFPAREPVYPLRLTGAGDSVCRVELFVFGEKRARIRHFHEDYCHFTRRGTQPVKLEHRQPALVLDDEFDRWTGNATVVTRLTGVLTPGKMKADAYLQWDPYRYRKPLVFSAQGARITALNFTVAFVVAGWLGVFLMEGGWKVTRTYQRTWYVRLFVAGLLVGLTIYFLLPKTAVKIAS